MFNNNRSEKDNAPYESSIITGANSGIGKAATLRFANESHTVIMACRSVERSKPVRDDIIKASNNKNVFLDELDTGIRFIYNRRITADTALRLSLFFGTTPKFWLGLQNDYDLEEEWSDKHEEFEKIQPV